MASAARKLDRVHGGAWCLHGEQKIVEALVLLDGRVGAHDDDAIVAILRPARPHFMAVDLPAVAVGLGAGAQPRKIRPARGLGKELAPYFLAQIGRASGRERGCQYWSISGVAGYLKQQHR